MWARGLIDEVIEADWRHPGWWAVAAWMQAGDLARAEVAPDALYEAFLTENAGSRADTFMARPAKAAPPAERVARAIARAEAAVRAVAALDGAFPGQALACAITSRDGHAARRPLIERGRVVFVVGDRRAVACVRAGDDHAALAGALARFAAGARPTAPLEDAGGPALDAAIAVALDDAPLAVARHLHRRAWGPGGGPWLGVGEAIAPGGRDEVVTTCHLAIDGYGHALVADAIFSHVDTGRAEDHRGRARAAEDAGAAGFHPCLAPARRDDVPLGIATTTLPAAPRLAPAAWATGFAVERLARGAWPAAARTRARFTPTFQIPVAPGDRADPARRRRRVVFGLCAVPMADGALADVAILGDRLGPWLAREAAARGILSRLVAASLTLPLPAAARARLLTSDGRPRRGVPMIEALAGRGTLALLRFADGERPRAPLVAASSPTLVATDDDPRGGAVISIVEHAGGASLTVAGTGVAGTEAGARAVLEDWLEGLKRCART